MRKSVLHLCPLLLSAALCLAQTGNSPPKNSISGRVVAADGGLAPGVRVGLTPLGKGGTSDNARFISADGEGRFTLNDLEARSYRLFALPPGYVNAHEDEAARLVRTGDQVTLDLVKGGAITGRVIKPNGEAAAGLSVAASRVRDEAGRPIHNHRGLSSRPAVTDDRGVYRIYGLLAGAYVVVANGGTFVFPQGSPYLGDVPIFHPASSRESAVEVPVTLGAEASGIDIKYRSERGFTLSGKVAGATLVGAGGVSVRLAALGGQPALTSTFVDTRREQKNFMLVGIAPGEYELSAVHINRTGIGGFAAPRRVAVRKAVSGLELVLAPLAMLSGKVVLEPAKAACAQGRQGALTEVLLSARNIVPSSLSADLLFNSSQETYFSLAGDGTFTLNMLEGGTYRLLSQLPDESWYVKSVTLGPQSSGLLSLKAGEKLAGVTVTLAAGAAQVRGKLQGYVNGRMRVHLVPTELAQANEILRYHETLTRADGSFVVTNIAPGQYWLVAKRLPANEAADEATRPLAWDATTRAALRADAEAAGQSVELRPCMRVNEYQLKW